MTAHENPRARRIELQLTEAQWYALHYLARKPSPFGERRTNTYTYAVLRRKEMIEILPAASEWTLTTKGRTAIAELHASLDRGFRDYVASLRSRRLTDAQTNQARRDYIRRIIG